MNSARPDSAHGFATTHWSLVYAARDDSPAAACVALEELCRTYWTPLYAWVRRRGYSASDAEDLTQEFFRRIVEQDLFGHATRELGRLRTFLLTAFQRFLANQEDRDNAAKRGGKIQLHSLDCSQAEATMADAFRNGTTPESVFERRWALALLDHVLHQLEREYSDGRHHVLFTRLRFCLTTTDTDSPYTTIAEEFGMTTGAIKVFVHRMRTRYREILLQEIRRTVSTEEEVLEELNWLATAVRI